MAYQRPEQPQFNVPIINPFTNPTVPQARKPISHIPNLTPRDPPGSPSTLETVTPSSTSTPEPESPEPAAYHRQQARLRDRRLNLPPHPYPTPPLTPVQPPIRLIVSTLTHIVPGEDHNARVLFLLNLLARYHFGTGYEVGKHRYYTRGTLFGYKGVRCWVCLDYGAVESKRRDSLVEVVAYRWAGAQLIPDPILPHDKEAKGLLRNLYPFTRPRNPALLTPSGKPKKPETSLLSATPTKQVPVHINVRNKLRYMRRITVEELDYMRSHLQDVDWLRAEGGLEEGLVRRLERMMQVRWRVLKREEEVREKEEEKRRKEERRRRRWGWGLRVWRALRGRKRKEMKEDDDEKGVEMVVKFERSRMREVRALEVEVEMSTMREVKEREAEMKKRRMKERRERMEMKKREKKKEERESEEREMEKLWAAWQQKQMEDKEKEEKEMDQVEVSWVIA